VRIGVDAGGVFGFRNGEFQRKLYLQKALEYGGDRTVKASQCLRSYFVEMGMDR
jgi:hypothetical protein